MTSERVQFARQLRKQPTRAEAILWERLRGARFESAKFRRQVPFDRCVVDFYCHVAKLVVDPRTAIRGGTASSMNGFRTTTPGGLKFSNVSGRASCDSPMRKSAVNSTPFWRAFATK